MAKTATKELRSHHDVLEAIADEINIPEHLDDIARRRYKSIGEHLDREDSPIKKYDPEIYPQGSFNLGTVTRPVDDSDDYDIDLVCALKATKQDFSMAELKEAVGRELRGYAKDQGMKNRPEDGRRCWTMEYADEARFHMDILPSLCDWQVAPENLTHEENWMHEICITDKTHPEYKEYFDEWPVSNPKGYGEWFNSRQSNVFEARRSAFFEANKNNIALEFVADVPKHKVKTPLQQAIQLLKRHRDVMFGGDEDKPISIIITTLSAHAYDGEEKICDTLRTILKNMYSFIETKNGVDWVANPVNPEENFADKWPHSPQKREKFLEWLDKAKHDFGLYLEDSPNDKLPEEFITALSKDTVSKVSPMIVKKSMNFPSISAVTQEVDKVVREGRETKPWCR